MWSCIIGDQSAWSLHNISQLWLARQAGEFPQFEAKKFNQFYLHLTVNYRGQGLAFNLICSKMTKNPNLVCKPAFFRFLFSSWQAILKKVSKLCNFKFLYKTWMIFAVMDLESKFENKIILWLRVPAGLWNKSQSWAGRVEETMMWISVWEGRILSGWARGRYTEHQRMPE